MTLKLEMCLVTQCVSVRRDRRYSLFSERSVSEDCSLCGECLVFSEFLLRGDCLLYSKYSLFSEWLLGGDYLFYSKYSLFSK
jgi:hypothetical protein